MWQYTRGYAPLLVLMVCMQIATAVLFLVQPFFYREAIDAIVEAQPGDAAVRSFAILHIALGTGTAALALTLESMGSFLLGWMQSRTLAKAYGDVFERVQRLSTDFHANAFAGATARKIGRGIDAIEAMQDKLWFSFLPTLFMLVGFQVALWIIAPPIAATVLIGSAAGIIVAFVLNGFVGRFHAWTDEQDTLLTANAVDVITSNALVKTFATEGREVDRQRALMTEWGRRALRGWSVSSAVTWTQFMLLISLEMAVLLLAVHLWYRGDFTPGSFVIVILYAGHLWGRLWDIGRNIRDYLKALAHSKEMMELVHESDDVRDADGAPLLRVTKGEIRFSSVTFGYQKQAIPVIDSLDLTIQPGERVALVGHSGGGKSTIIKLLLRLYDPQKGGIFIDNQCIAEVTQESLRSSIALVMQEPLLFHRSLRDNIAYGMPDATDAQIRRAAKLAYAHLFIDTLPDGYDTEVGERGVKLSGGERQRVALARAILADRPILVLDEATSSLDSLSERYVQEALEYLMKDRTSIVIAHRLSTIIHSDRILVVEGGRIVEQGSHRTLLRQKDSLYRKLYEMQSDGFIGE